MFKSLLSTAVAGLMVLATLQSARADNHDDIVLTVTGAMISNEASGDARTYNMAALQALPVTTVETSTIWTDGVHSFAGVSLSLIHI